MLVVRQVGQIAVNLDIVDGVVSRPGLVLRDREDRGRIADVPDEEMSIRPLVARQHPLAILGHPAGVGIANPRIREMVQDNR